MFLLQIKEYLEKICEQIKYKPIRNEIAEELKSHIEEQKENYMEEGFSEKEAEANAIQQMGDAKEIGIKLNKIHKPKLDWILMIIIGILLSFGIIVTCIHTRCCTGNTYPDYNDFTSIILGIAFGIGIYFMDYRKILRHSTLIYIITTILMIFTILKSDMVNGRICLDLWISRIAPSVVVLPLYVISFVGFLEDINKKSKVKIRIFDKELNFNVIKIVSLSIISIILLMSISDNTGSCILILAYFILTTVKLLKSNNKKRNIGLLYGSTLMLIIIFTLLVLVFYNNYPGAIRMNRILASFNPNLDPQGSGWVSVNQKVIIDSANLVGEANDMSNAINMFDEGTSHAFISVLAHYGWFVSIAMVLAIFALNIKLILNAVKIKDMYGKLLIIGIASLFILESTFNLLMNLNLGIQASFSIPLISYGRVNLIISIMSLALVMSIYRRKNINFQTMTINEFMN